MIFSRRASVHPIAGEWTVEYNAENRPIRWTQGNKVITMGFDRMGRRVFYKEMEGNRQITHTVFIWDPTEPLAKGTHE